MQRLFDYLVPIAITLWVGGLWAVGYLVAPSLFQQLASNRALAGAIAGELFSLMAWVGIGCAAYLLLFVAARRGWSCFRSGAFWLVLLMLVVTLVGHFGIQPIMAQLKADALPREVMESVLRDRFARWHGVSSVLYLIQSVLGLLLVSSQGRLYR